MSKQTEASFEKKIKELETLIEKLNSGDAGLEEALGLYEKGVKLLKECHATLDAAEKKLELLTQKDGKPALQETDPKIIQEPE